MPESDDVNDETYRRLVDEAEEMGDVETRYNEDTDKEEIKLTESGLEQLYSNWRENDEAVLRTVEGVVGDLNPQTEKEEFTKLLNRLARNMRDDGGVNVFRVLNRHPKTASNLGIGSVSDDLIERFEPETDTDEES